MPQANNIKTPNIAGNFLNAFQAGTQTREAREKRNALSRIGQTAGSGDLAGAQRQALEAGEFGVAGQLEASIGRADAKVLAATKVFNNDVARAAFAAQTPEQWDRAIDRLAAQYPSRAEDLLALKGQFSPEARESAISRALTIDQMIVRAEKQQGKLETIFDEQTGQPRKALVDAQGNILRNVGGAKAPSGTNLSVDSDGNVTFSQGSGVDLQKKTRGNLEGKTIDAIAALDRLNEISNSFDPKFQQVGTRASRLIASAKAKGNFDVSAEEGALLRESAEFQRDSLDNLNQTLKDLSGAAVSDQEFGRVSKSLPNPGTGLFDGDDPVTFKAKLDDAIGDTRRAIARYNFWLRNGLEGKAWDVAPLNKVDDLINERGAEIQAEIKRANPGMDQETLDAQTMQALQQEFGVLN